jgi:hypothetical protein
VGKVGFGEQGLDGFLGLVDQVDFAFGFALQILKVEMKTALV